MTQPAYSEKYILNQTVMDERELDIDTHNDLCALAGVPCGSQDSHMSERDSNVFTSQNEQVLEPTCYVSQRMDNTDHADEFRKQLQLDDSSFSPYLQEYTVYTTALLRNVMNPIFLSREQNHDFDFLLKVKEEHQKTMDSASKAFRLIPKVKHDDEDEHGDHNLYMQPYEGSPYYFVSETNSMSVPRHIEDVLYFFYMLKTFMEQNGITNFAVPTEKLKLEHNKSIRTSNSKVVTSIIEQSEEMVVENLSESARINSFESVQSIFNARTGQCCSELREEREFFSIKIAFTGAVFESRGQSRQSLFCLGIITPLKNFDLYGYIRHVFLAPPKNPILMDLWKDLCAVWKHIIMYEANYNCGLYDNPMTYENNPGGKLGFFTLTNMLNAPIRIYNVVMRQNPSASKVYILGCPKLSFCEDMMMQDYILYMHRNINEITMAYSQLQTNIQAYNTTKPEEQASMKFQLMCCGGWPLKANARNHFVRFGHFRWPIMLSFEMQKILAEQLKKSGFLMNYGNLPLSVEKKLRDFCTYDPGAENGGIVPDEHILKSCEEATPLRVLETYYNFDLNVMEDKKEARLLIWYEAFRQHVCHGRGQGYMTPMDAISQMNRHIMNCMEQHKCTARINGYGSDIVKQYMFFVDNMEKTSLSDCSLKSFLNIFWREKCPVEIRHNVYMRQSYHYLSAFADMNRDMNLNALNLEAFVSILLACSHWLMGAHTNTFIAFAQCVFMAGGVGHLDVTLERDQPQMDWRKQNSTGAGFLHNSMNVNLNELAKLYMQTPEKNKCKVQSFYRSTKVAIEGECCETFMNDQKVGEPSPETKFCNFIWSENRKKITDWETVITTMFPRDGENSDGWSLSTADPFKGSNLRATLKKRHIAHLFICLFCTNEKPDVGDVPQTIAVVLDMIDPGAEAYEEEGQKQIAFNSVRCKR